MARPGSPTSPDSGDPQGATRREPYGDPWQAFGYLVAGVLFYGALGYLLDRWLDTRFLVVVGILFGAGLGIYMSFGRFGGTRTPTVTHHPDDPAPDEPKEPQL